VHEQHAQELFHGTYYSSSKDNEEFAPSSPPIWGRFVFGSVTASATAASMESTANTISANSILKTVPQNPDCFFSSAALFFPFPLSTISFLTI
jgi:hypothetical protein